MSVFTVAEVRPAGTRSTKTRDNGLVPLVPPGLIDQAKIGAAVQELERVLAPDVIRIMYSVTLDWMGETSLFFRVVISDAASAPARLRETTQRIIATILQEIKAEELGLQTYFNFRSRSEQEMLREPFWERQ
jgi:hypothetical protein